MILYCNSEKLVPNINFDSLFAVNKIDQYTVQSTKINKKEPG